MRTLLGLALAVAACAPDTDSQAGNSGSAHDLQCTQQFEDSSGAAQAQGIRRNLESGATFALARSQIDSVRDCSLVAREGIVEANYRLGTETTLTARFDPRIGHAVFRIEQPGIAYPAAIRMLQAMERDQLGSAGCGIPWENSGTSVERSADDSRMSFHGSICNCRGTIGLHGDRVDTIVFSSAC